MSVGYTGIMSLEIILKEVGLTDKEAAVYLALLELGTASVLRIASKAGVKRPTAYITLAVLQEKGFVEMIPKGVTTLYQAADTEKIYERFSEKLKTFSAALPELRSIANAAPAKPRVRFYEGKKNILGLYEHEIFRAKEIMAVVDMAELRKVFSREELNGMLHLLKANGGTIRELLEDSPEAREYLKEKIRLVLGEHRFLPVQISFAIDLLVYGDTVAMISPKNLIAVVIEDGAISSAQRQFLEFLWNTF